MKMIQLSSALCLSVFILHFFQVATKDMKSIPSTKCLAKETEPCFGYVPKIRNVTERYIINYLLGSRHVAGSCSLPFAKIVYQKIKKSPFLMKAVANAVEKMANFEEFVEDDTILAIELECTDPKTTAKKVVNSVTAIVEKLTPGLMNFGLPFAIQRVLSDCGVLTEKNSQELAMKFTYILQTLVEDYGNSVTKSQCLQAWCDSIFKFTDHVLTVSSKIGDRLAHYFIQEMNSLLDLLYL